MVTKLLFGQILTPITAVVGIIVSTAAAIVISRANNYRRSYRCLLLLLATSNVFHLLLATLVSLLSSFAFVTYSSLLVVRLALPLSAIAVTLVSLITAAIFYERCLQLRNPLEDYNKLPRVLIILVITTSILFNIPKFFENKVVVVNIDENNTSYYTLSPQPLMQSHPYQLWYLIIFRTIVVTLIPSGLGIQFLRVARHYGVRDSTHSYPAFVSIAILFMICHLPRLCESIGALVFRGNKSVASFMWSISIVFPFSRWALVLYSSLNLTLVVWRDPGLWEEFRDVFRGSKREKNGELYHSNSFIDLGV